MENPYVVDVTKPLIEPPSVVKKMTFLRGEVETKESLEKTQMYKIYAEAYDREFYEMLDRKNS